MGAPARQAKADEIRRKILSAFSERARTGGLRGIVMAELAAELGISTRTLYQHFATKEELLTALVERWSAGLAAQQAARHALGLAPVDQLKAWAEEWTSNTSRFSPAFWTELERDYPGPHAVFRDMVQRRRSEGEKILRPLLRADLRPELLLELFDAVVRRASDPLVCERLAVTRKEAVVAAVDLWAQGALSPEAKRGRVPAPNGGVRLVVPRGARVSGRAGKAARSGLENDSSAGGR